ncbi:MULTISPECIES: type II toxin-antitoxin system VapC family toxin [unclassified Nostoc]|uniref:type II toxin-antitoxin system VapC family toxin n=1 Tax=unclassified Nostoc TaxID=2593658 RepID=UPI002AD30798|nr:MULTISPECIES: type II toxin-antitoxin system VapC family toxin [unclassified Nostoc]MDZ8120931.1 type II toxin-antitoxin system VapC family toxin [Nostoc sp. CmiVER01]MDZ8223651.1 type II toxin-antitoxin system VapC family toxin [Nostoc sp. ChiVER01]
MRLLLDTHTFIWYVTDNSRLSNQVVELINNENNEILLSIASLWEIAIKQNLGKLSFNQPFEIFITQQLNLNDFRLLDIKISHVTVVATLPLHHRDPFDRILIAQSVVENIPLLSADKIFDAYPIRRVW